MVVVVGARWGPGGLVVGVCCMSGPQGLVGGGLGARWGLVGSLDNVVFNVDALCLCIMMSTQHFACSSCTWVLF